MDLLNDLEYIKKVNHFSIRIHDAVKKGRHYDFCLGSKDLPFAIDFVVPKNLPKKGDRPRLGIMMKPHDNTFLFEESGIIKERYGKGTWKKVRSGVAKITRETEHSWLIQMNNARFVFYIPQFLRNKIGNFLIKRI
ncbi:MAG: hypothetical protein ACTSX4_12505 [Candidatus Helarchaeota archaeon]